jgi:hypothetical protein
MTPYDLVGFVILLVLSLLMALAIWALVSQSLEGVLNQAVKLPEATTFFLRCFLLGLLLAALAGSFGTTFTLKPDAHFMEYVWRVAEGLHDVCGYFFGFLLGDLVLVTVLVAALRFKHEQ